MASPFAVFRRNQKLMLAIVGIGAMIAFVFLDPVMRYVGRGRMPQNPVVVQTRYGALKESDLANLRQSRQLVENFLRRAAIETIAVQIEKGVIDPRMQVRAVEEWYGTWHQEIMGRSTTSPEESAVETYVLAKKAQQMGMMVSDQAINDLIKQVTADSLPSETIIAIINSLQAGRRVSLGRLFDAIRTEMLAAKFSQAFAMSLRDIPPAQRFEYYSRLNRRAKIEEMPLAVADFVNQVADPSTDELTKFYEQFKERYPDPNSPEPGFKQPKRAAFQYFKADVTKFKEELKPQVTDDEIREYYEKNKAQFRVIERPDDKPEAGDGSAEEERVPAADEEVKPAETPSPAPSSGAPNESPESSRSQSRRRFLLTDGLALLSPIRLIGLLEQTEQDAVSMPAIDQPAAAPADEQIAAEEPAEKRDEQPRYEPLEKVQDTIRDSIVAQKASKRISEIFDELQAEMRRYSDDLDIYKARQAGSTMVAPKPFPFAELAKKYNLEAKELPLVTAAEAAQEDIGKVFRIVEDRRSQFGFRSESFAEFAFSDSLITYRPQMAEDSEGNDFLFWKTEEQAAFVPTLEAVRNQVVRAWKMIKARELARKRAEEYAIQARAAGKPLAEVFANQSSLKASETGFFSWLSIGNVPFDALSSQPRISQVEGVEHPGAEFMEAVFSLSAGELGVALNHPQDTAYLMRLVEFQRTLDELREDFAKEPAMRYLPVAITDQRKVFVAWLADLNKDAGVRWERQVDADVRRGVPGTPPPPIDDDF